jgi:CrcB protein
VNIAGCLAIGALYKFTVQRELHGSWWELALRVGFLGGLTTFSSFGLDVLHAWHARPLVACAIVAAHLVLGLGAVAVGMLLVK